MDEHIWRPSRIGSTDRAVTGMVDLTRDEHGVLHARLLDVVPGRSGTAYATWLKDQPEAFTAGIKHAALDPFRGYANALRDELPDAVAVLDAFHVVKLGTNVLDEVRRRVQQDTLSRRGHKDDPLYKIRGLLRRGREHLSDKQIARLNAGLVAGDPGFEVTVAWHAYQQLRSIYRAETPAEGKRLAEKVIDSFPHCPIPEVARLGRTLRTWRQHVLARFDRHRRVSNGGTEAVNLIIEKTRRLAHGFRTFEHYRLRILLAASGRRAYRRAPPMPNSEEPAKSTTRAASTTTDLSSRQRRVRRRHAESASVRRGTFRPRVAHPVISEAPYLPVILRQSVMKVVLSPTIGSSCERTSPETLTLLPKKAKAGPPESPF